MSQKRKQQRERHNAQEEKKGKNVVTWIFGGLIALAIIYISVILATMS